MIPPRTILVLRFSSIGDIIQTTSVLGTIKKYYPDTIIDFMTISKYASLLQGHTDINNLHVVDIDANYKDLKNICNRIESFGYDLLIDLHNTTRSKIIRRLMVNTKSVQIKKPRWKRFKLFGLHLNSFSKSFSVRTWLHEPIKIFLPKNAILSKTKLFISDFDKLVAKSLIKSNGIDGPFFIIAPGAAWSQKSWLAERYILFIKEFSQKYKLSPLMIGGSKDIICNVIKKTSDSNLVDIHGKTSLRESLAIISQSKFIIGGDTGLIHAAEALKIPALTILGPTSRETGAGIYNEESQIVEESKLWCRPCSQNGSLPCYRKKQYCISEIKVDRVIRAVEEMISL